MLRHLLLALLFVAGAAQAAPPELLIYRTCAGAMDYVQIHTSYALVPAVECAVQIAKYDPVEAAPFLFGAAVACSYRVGHEGYIVLPYWGGEWLKRHEVGHLTGRMTHPPLLPVLESWCEQE